MELDYSLQTIYIELKNDFINHALVIELVVLMDEITCNIVWSFYSKLAVVLHMHEHKHVGIDKLKLSLFQAQWDTLIMSEDARVAFDQFYSHFIGQFYHNFPGQFF